MKITTHGTSNKILSDMLAEYGIPDMEPAAFVVLAKRVVLVYHLDVLHRKITFEQLCSKVYDYMQTPFGRKALQDAINNN